MGNQEFKNSAGVPAAGEDKKLEYDVNGEHVTLSRNIVRKYLVRGDAEVTDTEIVLFMSLCAFNKLNPFLSEAYLVKFQGKNPTAQMIVSKEAFFKRAEQSDKYEGYQAGIIVERNKEVLELEGAFTLEGDKLLGGWAKVYRSDRKFPAVAKVNLSEYDKKKSIWLDKAGTMISKVAKVQALREAFPTNLSSLYTEDETPQEVDYEDVTEKVQGELESKANRQELDMPRAEDPTPEPKVVKVERKEPKLAF